MTDKLTMISPSWIFDSSLCSMLPLIRMTLSWVSAQLLASLPRFLFRSQPGVATPQLQMPDCWSFTSQ